MMSQFAKELNAAIEEVDPSRKLEKKGDDIVLRLIQLASRITMIRQIAEIELRS